MKRLLLAATLVATALPSVAAAEDASAGAGESKASGTWTNGVKFGLTFSTLGGDVREEISGHTGTALGYFLSYRLGGGLVLQPEVIVTERGAQDAILNESGRTADLTYSYLDIPVFARYELDLGMPLTPYGYGGPNLSINIDSNRLVGTNSDDWDDQTSLLDFGFAAGLGADYLINNGVGLTLDIRYSMGFLNTDDTSAGRTLTNRQLVVMLGVWK